MHSYCFQQWIEKLLDRKGNQMAMNSKQCIHHWYGMMDAIVIFHIALKYKRISCWWLQAITWKYNKRKCFNQHLFKTHSLTYTNEHFNQIRFDPNSSRKCHCHTWFLEFDFPINSTKPYIWMQNYASWATAGYFIECFHSIYSVRSSKCCLYFIGKQ